MILNVYQLSIQPSSSTDLQPLADASIEVFYANGNSVAHLDTGNSGSVSLELAKGVYKVSVSAKGYTSASGAATVNPDMTTTIKFSLRSTSRFQIGGR